MNTTTVDTVSQFAGNGRYIRKATRVRFSDGREVAFIEKLPKRLAIAQAEKLLAKRGCL